MLVRSFSLITTVVALSACNPAPPEVTVVTDDPDLTYSVLDSAGVRIVLSREPAWQTLPSIDRDPVLSYHAGAGGDEEAPFRTSRAVLLEGGTLVLADAGRRELRWITPEGLLAATYGGTATLGSISALFPVGADSVALYDASGRRVTHLSAEGEPGTESQLEGFPIELAPVARLDDGSYLVGGASGTLTVPATGPEEIRRRTLEVLRVPPSIGENVLLAQLQGAEIGIRESPASPSGFVLDLRFPFARNTFVSGGPGNWVSADNAAFEVRFWALDGTLRTVGRRDVDPTPVTDDDHREFLEAFSDPVDRTVLSRVWNSWDDALPRTRPFFTQLLVDAEGRAWVREAEDILPAGEDPAREARPDSGESWSVFAPDGIWLGSIQLPSEMRLVALGDAVLVAAVPDPRGGESIRIHRLVEEFDP